MNMATVASSSTPSSSKNHDVFLSFRGQDVRKGFISHLYKDLSQNGIGTFKDDTKLKIGDQIPQSLLNAIEESKVYVVVFSKNYADSRWCLNELVHILKCRENGNCLVPVFYDGVEPSHVRNQTGSYEAPFVELEKKFKIDELSQWKDALKRAADITGLESTKPRNEAELVDEIVKVVKCKLNDLTSPIIDIASLVGIKDQVADVLSLLNEGSAEVRFISIWGIGGIGKTTLAKAVFSELCSNFASSYFLEGVSDELKKGGSFTTLRNKLLARILKEYNAEYLEYISSVKERLRKKNVLVVLDDLSDLTQFDNLFSEAGFKFGNKSRIIVTTRYSRVVKACEIYNVKELKDKDAVQVFCSYAFDKSSCPMDYTELTKRVVKDYAKGLPFALKCLGKYLNSRSKRDWESMLEKLKRIPHKEVQDMLEKSFDGLDDENKEIFLDIACFFKGEDRGFAERILDGCKFSSHIGIEDLIDRSLVTVGKDNKLWMHNLIQQMGQEIVSKKSRENRPNIPCRLWNEDQLSDALGANTGKEVVEGIFIDKSKIETELHLNRKFFSKMRKLRFLKICNSSSVEMSKVDFPQEGLKSLPHSLVYFHWHKYPWKYMPSKFTPKNLVEFSMPSSHVEKLWNEEQSLRKLKRIDLSNSEHLTQFQDLSLAINVESINLECCRSFLQLPKDFQNLNKLTYLNLNGCSSLQQVLVVPRNLKFLHMKNCTKLESFDKNMYKLKSLCHLDLSGCSNLKYFPEIESPMECLEHLILDRTAIVKLPSSIRNLTALKSLRLDMCEKLEELPDSISTLICLQSLSLRNCSKLRSLPDLLPSRTTVETTGCTSLPRMSGSKEVRDGLECVNPSKRLKF